MIFYRYLKLFLSALTGFLLISAETASAQNAYYIDGYHGGVWGHYPDWNTRFMADMLTKNPNWKINIELEPETWDRAQIIDPAAYADFKALFADQSLSGRIEYVNPAYAQSYMYNISGESIIRQLSYGMKKIRAHFPGAVFNTYSSEEPCFTSALPQILKSFGFKYASLKNPNTCFGGYTRPHSGELVNWIGPDGSSITTSPRYNVEKLAPKSTWQTIAWTNDVNYIKAALADGMPHPIGMTLQDAGWKGGPFIGRGTKGGITSTYTTWRNYFGNVAKNDKRENWKVSQEDMLVNLVWGSQITQQIAQHVRISENKLLATEKLAAMAKIYNNAPWPQAALDSAWRTMLLSEHHDCWIVPYNNKAGKTWAGWVNSWTDHTDKICDSINNASTAQINKASDGDYLTVYNTTGTNREEIVTADLPAGFNADKTGVFDSRGQQIIAQINPDKAKIIFKAKVPSIGYAVYQLKEKEPLKTSGASIKQLADGKYCMETDLYRIIIDPAHGGIIKSIIAKKLNNKEFVDQADQRGFNGLRGNFYNDGGFKSTADSAAKIDVIANGALSIKLAIKGRINGSDYTQTISLAQGEQRIDVTLNINWKGNPGIGQATPPGTYKMNNPAKAFYDDRNKLLAMFPLNLKQQKVYKNAPFDVMESKLDNTFFTRWDSIKNNVILNWADVTDGNNQYGMALFTDHTTSYTHGRDFLLGLTIQYSGMGLWGMNYTIAGPTTVHYALLPHAGKWDKAGIEAASAKWNEPLKVAISKSRPNVAGKSLITVPAGIEITSITFSGDDMLVRLFSTNVGITKNKITFNCNADKAMLTELDGRVREKLLLLKQKAGEVSANLLIPQFGVRTVKLVNARKF